MSVGNRRETIMVQQAVEVRVVVCDNCNLEAHLHLGDANRVPKGWYMLALEDGSQIGSQPEHMWDLCSLSCVQTLANELAGE